MYKRQAANAASDATSIAKKSIQSIDISDAKKVQEKAAAALQSAKNTASDFAENAGAAVSDLVARTTSDENERINGIALQDDHISKIGATRILYYLMAADGDVKPEELEKFDLIGNALLQNYAPVSYTHLDVYKRQLRDSVANAQSPCETYDPHRQTRGYCRHRLRCCCYLLSIPIHLPDL